MNRTFSFAVVAVLATCLLSGALQAQESSYLCLNGAESRESVAEHRLMEPLVAVRTAQATVHPAAHAEVLSSKLCHMGETFVYEVALLQRDGRLLRLYMNARDGKMLGPLGKTNPYR